MNSAIGQGYRHGRRCPRRADGCPPRTPAAPSRPARRRRRRPRAVAVAGTAPRAAGRVPVAGRSPTAPVRGARWSAVRSGRAGTAPAASEVQPEAARLDVGVGHRQRGTRRPVHRTVDRPLPDRAVHDHRMALRQGVAAFSAARRQAVTFQYVVSPSTQRPLARSSAWPCRPPGTAPGRRPAVIVRRSTSETRLPVTTDCDVCHSPPPSPGAPPAPVIAPSRTAGSPGRGRRTSVDSPSAPGGSPDRPVHGSALAGIPG